MLRRVGQSQNFLLFQVFIVLTVCYYVTCAFQSESTLYSCLNVKELLAQNRCDIWSFNHLNSRYRPVSSKELLDIQTITECEFTLKLVRDLVRTYSQMHGTDKYLQVLCLASASNLLKQRGWHRKQNLLFRGVASLAWCTFVGLIRFPAAFDHSTESYVM